MFSITGLGSGLDINGLVTQLVAAERAGSDLQLNRQSAKLNAKFSALGTLKSSLSSFQSSLQNLNQPANYSRKTAISSATAELTAVASNKASLNSYSISVSQLAGTEALASQAFAERTTAIGTGTISIRFGTTDYEVGTDTYNGFSLNPESSSVSFTIDSSNNTLDGIMQTINAADAGVRASIINDGSGYRLLLSAEASGESNSLEITASDDGGTLSAFNFNAGNTSLEQTAAAQDAVFTVNGLTVTSAENTVEEVIDGLTLFLKDVTTSAVEVKVQADTSAVVNGLKGFIAAYNQLAGTVQSLSAYDAENDIPSPLLGDFTLRSIEAQISAVLRSSVNGLDASASTLAEAGVSTDSEGKLVLDSSRFNALLADKPAEIARLFAAIGTPDDALISYIGAEPDTQTGVYDVEVTTLASQGFFEGAGVLPDFGGGGTLGIDADNDTFRVEIDGIDSGELNLSQGVYSSGEALATELQTRINGASALSEAGLSVQVVYDASGNRLRIQSLSFGGESKVNLLAVDINSMASLGFSVASGTDGNDVAGLIDGVAATGIGKVLTAAEGTGAEGLAILIEGGATGSRGQVNFTRGLSDQLDRLMTRILETEAPLTARIDSYQARMEQVEERRQDMELRWALVEERYLERFNALDRLLAELESTSSYMEEQFKNLLKPYSGRQ